MTRRMMGILLVLVSMAACMPTIAQSPAPSAASPTTGAIAGRAVDATTGEPIVGANVTTDPPTGSVTTGADGGYTVADVPPGTYIVTATNNVDAGASVKVAVDAGRTTPADLHLRTGPSVLWLAQSAASLVAYYPFAGSTLDASGNNQPGELSGATLADDRQGRANNAYYFDGVDDSIVTHPREAQYDLTVSFWLKTQASDEDSWPWDQFVIDHDQCGNYRDWSITLGEGAHILFSTGMADHDVVLVSTAEVNDGRWHHVVVLRDANQGMKRVYLDSALDSSQEFDALPFGNSEVPVTIGASFCETGFHDYFWGEIDDVLIYDRAITEDEIRRLYRLKYE